MAVLGTMLRELRQRAGWTQEELADRAAISVRSLRDLEAGRVSKPRTRSVRLLADALGLTDHERRQLLSAAAPPPTAHPRVSQLPAGASNFTGRLAALEQLNSVLTSTSDYRTMVVSAVGGAGGAGKTALVVHWAHQVAQHFPDGQLYINLRGFTPGQTPTDPSDALGQFLRALGVAYERVPTDVEEQASLYRSLLADRRMLVVLDNAASADQVRPLLPGRGASISVVTSRDRLAGLVTREGAVPLHLDVLAPQEARQLLDRLLGSRRVTRESDACDQLAQLCGYLPLAIRVVGASLAMSPARSLSDAVDRLSTADRLESMDVPGDPTSSVSTAFDLSYSRLAEDVRTTFRRLAIVPGSDFSLRAVASLMACSAAEAERLLSNLADLSLVELANVDRFALHDLARLFAERRLVDEPDLERSLATRRLMSYYLHSAEFANRCLRPSRRRPAIDHLEAGTVVESFQGYDAAFSWCEAELTNLTAAVGFAAEHSLDGPATQLPTSLIDFYMIRTPWPDWIATHQTALRIARRIDDRFREGILLRDLGLAYRDLRRFDDARSCYERAVAISRNDPDPLPLSRALSSLGILCMDVNQNKAAIPYFTETFEIAQRLNDRYGAMLSIFNLGFAYLRLNELDLARRQFELALDMACSLGEREVEAGSLGALGAILRAQGRVYEAIEKLRASLATAEATGNRTNMIEASLELGSAHRETGDLAQARQRWEGALSIARDLNDPRVDEIEGLITSTYSRDK